MLTDPHEIRLPTGLALVEEGAVRMAPLLGLPPLLVEFGLEPWGLITAAGVAPALFGNPENTIPFADLGRLLAHCAARTGCPHLGLLLGQRTGLDALGVVGRLASHAPNLREALQGTILYLHLHDRGAVPALWTSGDRAMLVYTIVQPDVPGIEQIYDGSLAITCNILRQLAGPGREVTEVRLCHPRPIDAEPYRRVFRTRLVFGAEHSALVFPSAWLDCPLGGANPELREHIMREIETLETSGAGDLVAQLRRVLYRLLILGTGPGETSLGQIAGLFAIHRRTLNRRLHTQGTSFKALIDASRYDIARQLLRDTRLPVVEVATALDYAHVANFTRAFHRWSGTSPAAWRAAHAPSQPHATLGSNQAGVRPLPVVALPPHAAIVAK